MPSLAVRFRYKLSEVSAAPVIDGATVSLGPCGLGSRIKAPPVSDYVLLITQPYRSVRDAGDIRSYFEAG